MGKSRWITKPKFNNLSIGEDVIVLYMIGKAKIVSEHYLDSRLQETCVDVKFSSGPWSNTILHITRKQISNLGVSYPEIKKTIFKKK